MTVRVKAYSHRFPTRLRLRFPQLRGAPLACAQFAASLRQVAGVDSVEASTVTGSVLVTYRVAAEAEQGFLARLQDMVASHGLSCDAPHAATQATGAGGSSALDGVAEKFVGAVVDKLAERAALALLAALL